MEYKQIQKKVLGIFETILKDKGRKPWDIKVHPNEKLKDQDFDSLDTMDAVLQVGDFFDRKYGSFIDFDNLEIPNNIGGTTENNYGVGLTPKNIVDYVAGRFPTTKTENPPSL